METGKSAFYELKLLSPLGVKHLEVTSKPIPAGDGGFLGWLTTLVGYLALLLALLVSAPLLVGFYISPYRLSYRKFFWDEIYDLTIVKPLRFLASVCYWLDRWLVDGLVNLCGRLPREIGSLGRSLQIGLIPFYALAMVLGALILLAARLILAAS